MSSVFFQQRLKNLKEHIIRTQKLRSEYEEMRDLSDDPKTKGRCEKAIEELKELAGRYYEEFEDLQQQLMTQSLLDALETNEIPQAEIEEMWELLEKRLLALTSTQAKVAGIIKNPGLDAKHKLKVCIPIIPLVLDYEGEIELGTRIDIKILWNQIKAWLRG